MVLKRLAGKISPDRKRKGILMLDVYFGAAILVACLLIMILAYVFFTRNNINNFKLAEETSTVDTHLYVLLNSNYCTPNTLLPFKYVLAYALSRDAGDIPGSRDDMTIQYNGKEDTLNIRNCLKEYANMLYLSDYNFYVEYDADGGDNGDVYLETGSSVTYSSDLMSREVEEISIPKSNSIASVVLEVARDTEIDTETTQCPEEENMYCIRAKTCQIYGGTCKLTYACGINQCCCQDMPV